MSGTLLEALVRNEKGAKVRKNGFVPGIIYDKDAGQNDLVKFKSDMLEKYLKQLSGKKVQIKLGQDTKVGFIKELQKDSITGKILHLDILTAGLNDIIKVKLPVIFEGRAKLDSRGLILNEQTSEVSIHGKEKDIPDSIIVDVGDKTAGDVITVSELSLADGIKIMDDPGEVLAIINEPNREIVEAEEETASATEQQ